MRKSEIDRLMEASRKAKQINIPTNINYALKSQTQALAEAITRIHTIDFSHIYSAIAKISINVSKFHKSIGDLVNFNITPMIANVAESVYLYQKQAQHFEEMMNKVATSYVSSLEQIRGNLLLSSAFVEQLRNIAEFQETFAVRLAESLHKTFEIDDETEQLNKVREITKQHTEEQSNAKLQLEVLIFIVAVISAMLTSGQLYYAHLQYKDSKQDSVEMEKRFSQFMNMFEDFIKKIEDSNENQEIYYIVKNQVQVKTSPRFKSATIVVIYPNQKVKLLKRKHKWIYIEYFDFIDGVPKNGWVCKKYLTKMK